MTRQLAHVLCVHCLEIARGSQLCSETNAVLALEDSQVNRFAAVLDPSELAAEISV